MKNYTNAILKYIYILFRLCFAVAIIAVIIYLLYYIFKLAYPFVFAIIFAFLINPFINFLVNHMKLPRGLSTILTLLLIFCLIIGLVTLIITQMISGVTYLTDTVPENIQLLFNYIQEYFIMKIVPLWEKLTHLIDYLNPEQQATINSKIQMLGQELANSIGTMGKGLINVLTNILFSLPSIITALIFVLLSTFFISKDWYKISHYFKKKMSSKIQNSVRAVYFDLQKALFGYLRAQVILISITGIIVLVGLLILRIGHPLTIAFITAIVDLLPYLGTGTIFIPWILYNFFIGHYVITISITILYAVIMIQRQMMEPKILSSSIGLEPLPTLISLFVGFKLFGVLGLFVGPAILVFLNALVHANVIEDIWNFIIGNDHDHL